MAFCRFGRCVSAEPAAVLAALLAPGSRSTLAAADAARALVTSRFALRALFPRDMESVLRQVHLPFLLQRSLSNVKNLRSQALKATRCG